MKKIFQIIVLAIGFFHLSLGAYEINKEQYLFATLEHPQYLALWNSLFENEENVDDWFRGYANSGDGPSGPGENVVIDGREYLIRNVCKTHDCGDNYFFVAFASDGTEALGLLKRIKYIRDFDFNQNKFVRKRVRENRFFGSNLDPSSNVKLKDYLLKSR